MLKFFAAFGITIGVLVLDIIVCAFLGWMWSDKNSGGVDFDDFSLAGFVINALLFSIFLAIFIVERFL